MRVMASAVLVFEAIVVALAIPVAITVNDVDAARAGWVGGLLAIGCLLAAGMLRTPNGYRIGSVLQLVVVAAGFVVPAMFFIGGVFAVLWIVALRLGAKAARPGDPGASASETAGPPPG